MLITRPHPQIFSFNFLGQATSGDFNMPLGLSSSELGVTAETEAQNKKKLKEQLASPLPFLMTG